jgi:uncharacterized lipoprotein YmbA
MILALPALAAACRAAPTRYYTLVPRPGIVIDRKLPLVAVRAIRIAKFLDRPQIVRHKTDIEFTFNDLDEWAEGVDDMATRVLIDDLALRLPQTQFAITDGALAPPTGTLLAVELSRFDPDPDGTTVLEARWTITRGDRPGEIHAERITGSAPPDDIGATVSALSDCLGQFADRIATALSAG